MYFKTRVFRKATCSIPMTSQRGRVKCTDGKVVPGKGFISRGNLQAPIQNRQAPIDLL